VILFLLGWSVVGEFRGGLYGTAFNENYDEGYRWMRIVPVAVVVLWLGGCGIAAAYLTRKGSYAE